MCTVRAQHKRFREAVAEVTADPVNIAHAIEVMMQLAAEAVNDRLRAWASVWLYKTIGLTVTQPEHEDFDDAAPPETANLR